MHCEGGGEVIAITLTPVRHKRHMQFLTSATNFKGAEGHLTPVTQFSRATGGVSMLGW